MRILNKKNKLFYRVIGGQSNFGIIIEATLKLKKIKFYNFEEKKIFIKNERIQKILIVVTKSIFGYINIFNRKNLQINCTTITPLKRA